MSSMQVAAYTYKAEQFTPAGIIEKGIREGWLAPAARDMDVEDVLDQAQHYVGVDRMDERSYDSDTFPKVIFMTDVEPGESFRDEHDGLTSIID